MSFAQFERRALHAYLVHQFHASGGEVAAMSRLIGRNRTDLYRMLDRYGVDYAGLREKHFPRKRDEIRRRLFESRRRILRWLQALPRRSTTAEQFEPPAWR